VSEAGGQAEDRGQRRRDIKGINCCKKGKADMIPRPLLPYLLGNADSVLFSF